MNRYIVALVTAAFIILMGFAFVWGTQSQIKAEFKRSNDDLASDPKAADLKYNEFNMPMSQSLQTQIDVSNWLTDFWYVLVPLVIGGCVGAAYLVGRIASK